ncbi:MAG: hypothetical protein ABIQ90_02100 [Polaromonas sp.]
MINQTLDRALSGPTDEKMPGNAETEPTSRAGLWFLLALLTTMLCLIFSPQIIRLVNGNGAPVAGEYLGSVQKVDFIGGLGHDTQVQTETRTVLVRGAVELVKGTRLERRRTFLTDDVCEVGNNVCHDLLSE